MLFKTNGKNKIVEATVDEQVEHESDNTAAKDGANDSEEHKDEETTQPTEVTSEQPARGLGNVTHTNDIIRRNL
jgi:hypothetical protein